MGSCTEDSSSQLAEDQCIFIGNSLLDVDNIDEWLIRNGSFFVTEETLESNMINQSSDPLLNQLNNVDKSSDDEVMVERKETPKPAAARSSSKVNRNTNNKLKKEKIDKINNRIKDLETKVKSGLHVSFIDCDNNVLVMFEDNEERKVLPDCTISIAEMGIHLFKQYEKQSIAELTRVRVVQNVELYIPCLITRNGFKLYLCAQYNCKDIFIRCASAKLHVLVHVGYKPYPCDHPNCAWAFYTLCKLKRHRETHLNKKNFECPIEGCLRKFTTVYNLNNHRRLHERPAELPCPVKNCDEMFQTVRLRERHLKSHDRSEAPFHCHVSSCKKSFFSNTALNAHTRTHMHKDSEVKCKWPNCGKVFQHPCRLKAHQRKHTGLRPYSCTYGNCKWTFSTASKLRRHQNIHTNERKYHCTIGSCNKSFLRSEHLKEHTLTHVEQKSCDDCILNGVKSTTLCEHLSKNVVEEEECEIEMPLPEDDDLLLEQAIQSLGVPSDMILGADLLPEEPLELLEDESFSTVNLRDLD